MKIDADDFRIEPGQAIRLDDRPTSIKPCCKSKKQYRKTLATHVEELSSLQQLNYASHCYALLLIFQGIDAAGKDGAIRHVMSGVNPQGCEVFSFKQPSAEVLSHDFLWRTTCELPERGRIASGWFAARPSGTEAIYEIYAESFIGEKHLALIEAEAKASVAQAFTSAAAAKTQPEIQDAK